MTADLDHVRWHKASASGDQGNCVEVADLGDAVAVRDSKDPDGPTLMFTPFEWECFLDGISKGEFDRSDARAS